VPKITTYGYGAPHHPQGVADAALAGSIFYSKTESTTDEKISGRE